MIQRSNNNSKKSSIIGVTITVLILVFLVIVSNIKIEKWSEFTKPITSFANGIQGGFVYIKNKISGNDSFFVDLEGLKSENEELKKQNTELQQKLREFEIIKAENSTLREYVNLTDKYSEYKSLPGYVIQYDITNYSKVIVINVGKRDGVDVNMPVISEKGLVGYVISTTDTTSKVQTIIDTASTVSSSIGTTKDSIITRGIIGSNRELKATFLPTDAIVLEGDSLETSGIGGIYPKGIHIGTIKKVVETKNITDRYAIIETAVDFQKLETVLVITN